MRLLLIDTSTKILVLGISENEKILQEKVGSSDARHGESISSAVKQLLKDAKLDLKNIDGYILGIGPGSFTGLRVASALIKALSIVTKKPYLGLPSLDLIAHNGLNYAKNICVISDAKQSKVYAAFYKDGKSASEYLLCPLKELIKKAKKIFKSEILFIGDAVKLYEKELRLNFKQAIFAEEEFWYPRPKALAQLGTPVFKKKSSRDLNKLKPLYLYPKECQIRKNK